MKKLVLLLALLSIGANAFAATRVVRTYNPLPYNRNVNPFAYPCHDCNNNFYPGNYYRNSYYSGRFNNYYPNYYNSSYDYYYRHNNFTPFQHVRRTIHKNNVNCPHNNIYRYNRSDTASNIVPVSCKSDAAQKDPRLSLVEKNVFGKSFENQELTLRLNRLEKSMFNKTYPAMSMEDRINNLFVNYNSEIQKINPDELIRLEKTVLKRTYEDDNMQDRVSRLEEKVLGAIQEGDINERVKTLNDVVISPQYQSYSQAQYGTCYGGYIPQQNNVSGWRRTLNNLGMMFGGCPTGWSPGVSPYDPYIMDQGGMSQSSMNNWGSYSYSNTRRGAGGGIQILD